MTLDRRDALRGAAAMAAAALIGGRAHAATNAIRLICGFGVGNPTDLCAQLIQDGFSTALDEPVEFDYTLGHLTGATLATNGTTDVSVVAEYAQSLLLTETQTVRGGGAARALGRGYDDWLRVKSRTLNGAQLGTSFDDAGMISALGLAGGLTLLVNRRTDVALITSLTFGTAPLAEGVAYDIYGAPTAYTPEEGQVTLTIPPGTSSGAKLRLKGKGFPNRKTGTPGDQYVVAKISVPKTIDADTQLIAQSLAERLPPADRSHWK